MAAIFFRIIIIFALLSFSMKIMGKREIGELEVGELITTLLISEICAIPVEDPDIPLLNAIIPVLFIVSVEIILSSVKNKSAKLKKMIDGEAVFLIYRGKLRQAVLRHNRLSIEELLSAMRLEGIGELSEVEYCILEPNGKISFLQKTPDMRLSHLIISDGEVIEDRLSLLGYNDAWLRSELGGASANDVFIMTVDDLGNTYILLKEEK